MRNAARLDSIRFGPLSGARRERTEPFCFARRRKKNRAAERLGGESTQEDGGRGRGGGKIK